MRDSTNPEESDERDGSEGASVTPPHKDDLRSIMFGRPVQRPQPIEPGQYSAESKSDAEPAWTDAASDKGGTDDPPWQGRPSQVEEPTADHEYQRPPFYTEAEQADDDRHPRALSRFGPPAGFGRRLVAYLIDNLVTIVVLSLLFPLLLGRPYIDVDAITAEIDAVGDELTALPTATPVLGSDAQISESDGTSAAPAETQSISDIFAGLLLAFAVTTIYNTVLIGTWGTTIGKRALNVYVLDSNGNIPGIPLAFARSLATIVSTLIFYIGYLFILREDHRALHDHLVGTYAITLSTEEGPAARGEELVD